MLCLSSAFCCASRHIQLQKQFGQNVYNQPKFKVWSSTHTGFYVSVRGCCWMMQSLLMNPKGVLDPTCLVVSHLNMQHTCKVATHTHFSVYAAGSRVNALSHAVHQNRLRHERTSLESLWVTELLF